MKPSINQPNTFTNSQIAAEINGIHINLTTVISNGSLLPEYRYTYHAGYSNNAIKESLTMPSMRCSRADGLIAIQRNREATAKKYKEIGAIKRNKENSAPKNPPDSNKEIAAWLIGLKTDLYKRSGVSSPIKAHAANNIGPIKPAMTSTTRIALELMTNPHLLIPGLAESTSHTGQGVSTDIGCFRRTGAGSTAQEIPEITFSEQAENA